MTTMKGMKGMVMAAALVLTGLLWPVPAAAHCDSVDGPVVEAAREALETGDVNRVLLWILPEGEAEIREAFDRTRAVRASGGEARALADRWFFETVVRVHREGEGAPYTGLKSAGYEVPAGIEAADRALELGSIDGAAAGAAEHLAEALRERFERVRALRDFAPDDVEAGRRYVHAYVEYIHFIEAVHELLTHGASH